MLSRSDLTLRNTVIGEGGAGGASTATLVLVEVSGRPGSLAQPERRVEFVVKSDGKVRFEKSIPVEVLSENGRFFAAFWLYDTGCEPLELHARITGQSVTSERTGRLNFVCGE